MKRQKGKAINTFDDGLKTYFNEISKYSPLSKEEEHALWEDYKLHGNLSARDKIIKSNLRFVATIANGYQGLGLSYSDLIAEGNCGLMKAMDKYDYTKGFKTISYSVWWIRQSILEAIKERGTIGSDELPDESLRQGNDEDECSGTFAYEDSWESVDGEIISAIQRQEKEEVLSMLMKCLTPKEKYVMSNVFGLDDGNSITLEEIGKTINLTKERVRQIKEKALKKLRSEALKNSITSDIYK